MNSVSPANGQHQDQEQMEQEQEMVDQEEDSHWCGYQETTLSRLHGNDNDNSVWRGMRGRTRGGDGCEMRRRWTRDEEETDARMDASRMTRHDEFTTTATTTTTSSSTIITIPSTTHPRGLCTLGSPCAIARGPPTGINDAASGQSVSVSTGRDWLRP
ncbi:hypothetical protein BDZ89DRAFT_1051372 [Hymenopellis radicata]|nr:hypothetical protein BDZ89DRAFT_1051372 [Hymenopellis radicata]